jgi:hypothetical protein
MLFSTRDREHARRVEDTFIFVAVVAGTIFSKGLTNSGVARKAYSNSLRRCFILAFFVSICPIESQRMSPVPW